MMIMMIGRKKIMIMKIDYDDDINAKAIFQAMKEQNQKEKESINKKNISYFSWLKWYLGIDIEY